MREEKHLSKDYKEMKNFHIIQLKYEMKNL